MKKADFVKLVESQIKETSFEFKSKTKEWFVVWHNKENRFCGSIYTTIIKTGEELDCYYTNSKKFFTDLAILIKKQKNNTIITHCKPIP